MQMAVYSASLPVWEEWIEIKTGRAGPLPLPSLPVWEEWIEIAAFTASGAYFRVSSRMGRVD